MQHTVTEKKIAKSVLDIMSKAIEKAMATINTHEGRFMKKELNLREVLEEPQHKAKKRKYVHTEAYWACRRTIAKAHKTLRQANKKTRVYTKRNTKYWAKKGK